MPELPEVETVVNTLKSIVLNKTILSADIYYEKIIKTDYNDFVKNIKNQKILDVKRRGKYIIFVLSDYYLISHLRMEGKYFLKEDSHLLTKHDHIVLNLDDKKKLIYNDVRKFGTMDLISKKLSYNDYLNLGVEPLSNDYTAQYLLNINSKKPIKTFLLDQNYVVGIGNIYVDEILFLSKVHPQTIKNNLSKEDVTNIVKNTKIILEKAIKAGGTTIYSYTSSEGITGLFQLELLVHTKVGQECPVCKNTISKIKVGGRGTYLCNKCQKLK